MIFWFLAILSGEVGGRRRSVSRRGRRASRLDWHSCESHGWLVSQLQTRCLVLFIRYPEHGTACYIPQFGLKKLFCSHRKFIHKFSPTQSNFRRLSTQNCEEPISIFCSAFRCFLSPKPSAQPPCRPLHDSL
jgi:hypothetical protein